MNYTQETIELLNNLILICKIKTGRRLLRRAIVRLNLS